MRDPLTRLLSTYPAQARPLGVPTPLGNAGGFSGARLWRFDSGLGPLVARLWPADGPGPEALGWVHGRLGRLADLGFVPVPLARLDGSTLAEMDGRSWEIAPWLAGSPDLSRPPSADRLRAAFAGLAAVHQRLGFESSPGTSPGLESRLREAERLASSELDTLESLARRSSADPVSALALRWISLARDGLPALAARLRGRSSQVVRLQPVLRDARPDHFLFEGDRLTGLVDFGAMGVESPAADLARLLGDWAGAWRPSMAAALEAYAQVRPIPDGEAALIDVFADSAAWLGPARWARWHLVEHRRFDRVDAVRLGMERVMERLRERLA
jgi:Ser/Thr protein kinase RdoA (MazF antagonist)